MRIRGISVLLFALFAASSILPAQEELLRKPESNAPSNWTESPIKPEIAGFVRFAASDKIPDPMHVRLETPTGTVLRETMTGKLGEFSFAMISCGSYVLAVDATGYRPVRLPVEHSYAPMGAFYLKLVSVDTSDAGAGTSVSAHEMQIPKAARKEYARGVEALTNNKAEEGIAHLRKAIGIFPDYDSAYVQLGWAYLQRREFLEAQKVLEQAVRHNEKNAAAYALLGKTEREQNHLADAARNLEHSLFLEEAAWRPQLELGEVLVQLGKTDQAYPHLVRAHQLNPVEPSVHLQLYNCLILRSDLRAAKAELDEFLTLFPHHGLAPRVTKQRDILAAKLQAPTR